MKTIFNNTSDYVMEKVKRTLYTLQVLVLVFAVPVLFATGITDRGHKNTPEHSTTGANSNGQLSAKPMATYTIVKI